MVAVDYSADIADTAVGLLAGLGPTVGAVVVVALGLVALYYGAVWALEAFLSLPAERRRRQ